MKERFDLSEKMKEDIQVEEHILHCEVFEKEDIKEFIRLLKEEIKPKSENPKDLATSVYPVFRIRQIIDKLSGEKLK